MHGTRDERVGVCHDRVGIIFFSGMLGSVWGSSRRLQVPYVIPRPGVTHHALAITYPQVATLLSVFVLSIGSGSNTTLKKDIDWKKKFQEPIK